MHKKGKGEEEKVDIDCVLEGLLFISGIQWVSNRVEIEKRAIAHIVTVSAWEISAADRIDGVSYHFFEAMDTESQDLLDTGILGAAVALIERSLARDEPVLVHCMAGMSRSATIVAAYLMKAFDWSRDVAIAFLAEKRPVIAPNPGFLEQLKEFEKEIASFPSPASETGTERPPSLVLFRCWRCRLQLFASGDLVGGAIGRHSPLPPGGGGCGPCCPFGHLLAEPMEWMLPTMGDYQGRIHCPRCGEKLGSYCWGGRQCAESSCGAFVTPWIHVQRRKVDGAKEVGE